jgi:hypothetical protein
MKTETKRPAPELVDARAMARDTMDAIGEYARRDVRFWNLDDLRRQINLLETALDYFDATGTK